MHLILKTNQKKPIRMIKIFTVGVYGSDEQSYFDKLIDNKIDLFLDIRQRRGVRGSQYRYVNSNYLQAKLKELNIQYVYVKELAPTKEIRQKQKDADIINSETKKQRTVLGPVFAHEYCKQILEPFDMDSLVEKLMNYGCKNVVLFCIEEHAEACHRSLVAKILAEKLNTIITNL